MNPKNKLVAVGLAVLASQFLASTQAQITLPAPIVRETFDSVEEGQLPAGWTVQNFTDDGTPGEDLNDPHSDSYKNWVVISRQRVADIGTAGGWEGPRRLSVAPKQFVNGVLITNLIDGKFIYAESDTRGGNQVQFLFSPDFDLSGKTNVYLFYNSIYEQNQDSIGAVEYSIDGGNNWLPIVYMLDGPDIVRDASGAADAVATFTKENNDAAFYLDPVTGEGKGGTYGAFIGATTNTWATLGPFISARVNDDPAESKRVELFRLPKADNQAKVRFRFAQAGTGSWYFGIDNFGLYSITASKPGRPAITVAATASVFSDVVFTGSSFQAASATQTHGSSLWQISDSPGFSADAGFSSVMETFNDPKMLTVLTTRPTRTQPGKTYYATVQYRDQSGGKSDFAEPASFVVNALPASIVLENFESTAEGSVPTGWKVENQTDNATGSFDPASLGSDTYLDWTVVTFENMQSFGANRVNNTNVLSGKSIYAESDTRGGNQIQYLTTPDFNLTGKNNVWLGFKSNYIQNQDSLGGLEYSIDEGKTWLPLLYMIDSADIILKTDGSINALTTLTNTYGDVAKIIDPATGERVAAGKYGDFVQARPLDALGPFISGRGNDNETESKRYERFRLTAADNQAKVRFRFVQAGTGSWFWGVDDFALFSVAPATPVRTKPDAPTLTLPASLSLFDANINVSGSAFVGIKEGDKNTQTVAQLSASSGFTAAGGLTNVFLAVTNSAGSTSVEIPSSRLLPGRTYYVSLQYKDQGGVASEFSAPVALTLSLPTPTVLETFESTPDFGVPTGWTVNNQTDVATAGKDPANPNSDTYRDWVVVPFATLTAFAGGRDDTNVVSGKSIYAESDNRGGNQIQYLTTPDFDLRGKNNVWLAFRSNYVQNQDSLGGLDYSVDEGKTWLPLLYLIDRDDIKRAADGSIDAAATLTTTYSDVAKLIDPVTNQRVAAGKYGDFVRTGPLDTLAPFISGRINDDKAESRRYERFRLAAADNQAKVRFRFVQAGTGSWWWGIDDFGLYSLGGGAVVGPLAVARQGNNIVVSWTGAGTLQAASDVTGPWGDLTGGSPQTITPSGQRKFYRLRQ